VRGWPVAAALAVAAAVAVLVLGATGGWWQGTKQPDQLSEVPAFVTTRLSPQSFVFGTPLQASLDVVLNPRWVDVPTVTIQPQFTPFRATDVSQQTKHVGGLVVISLRYRLECLTGDCLPTTVPDRRLAAGTLSYYLLNGTRQVRPIAFPPMRLLSNVSDSAADALTAVQADSTPTPVTYGASPSLVAAGLLTGTGVFACLAAGLVVLAFRRRRAPVGEADAVAADPLHQALDLARAHSENGTPAARRMALQRLARELGTTGRGELADAAERLAWSPADPSPDDVAAMVTRTEHSLEEHA
jgi:hypothetical protein